MPCASNSPSASANSTGFWGLKTGIMVPPQSHYLAVRMQSDRGLSRLKPIAEVAIAAKFPAIVGKVAKLRADSRPGGGADHWYSPAHERNTQSRPARRHSRHAPHPHGRARKSPR